MDRKRLFKYAINTAHVIAWTPIILLGPLHLYIFIKDKQIKPVCISIMY